MSTGTFAAPRIHSPPTPLRHPGAKPSPYTTEAILAKRKEEKSAEMRKVEKEGKLARVMRAMGCGIAQKEERGRGREL
jgi:hypothetical protein